MRQWDPQGIPDSDTLPTDTYLLRVETLAEVPGGTKGGENAKLPAGCVMYLAQFVVEEPAAYAAMRLGDYFVLGTASDPEARDPKTYAASVGAKQLKRLLVATRATLHEDLDESCRNAAGNKVVAFVTTRAGNRGGEFNDIKRYYKIGERQPGSGTGPAPGRPNGPVAQPAGPPPMPPTASAGPAAPKVATTAAPSAAATAGAKAAKKAPKPQMVTCPTCQEDVERDGFPAHMDAHDSGDEAEA